MGKTSLTALILLVHLPSGAAGEPRFIRHRLPVPTGEEFRGASIARKNGLRLYAWGTDLWEWRLPSQAARLLAAAVQAWGGCPVEPDGVLLQEQAPLGNLTLRRPPDWKPQVIDTGVELLDCAPAKPFGRPGMLVVQRGMQVRFYEPGRPTYREIYSFYTPSRQAGILLADVDRDGRIDILCGNYWIRQPRRFELPWRLFAINTYAEREDSATFRLALADLDGDGTEDLIVSQAEMNPALLAWFGRPPDPRELWREQRLNGGLNLVRLRGLAVADLDGDSRPEIAAGEDNGADSRLLVFHNLGDARFAVRELSRGDPILRLFALDVNGDRSADLVSVGRNSIEWWENQRRR